MKNTPTSQPPSERHIYDIESDKTDDVASLVELETWYFGNIDSSLARTKCKKEGDFLLKYSINKQRYVISCRLKDTCHHSIVQVSISSNFLLQKLLILIHTATRLRRILCWVNCVQIPEHAN